MHFMQVIPCYVYFSWCIFTEDGFLASVIPLDVINVTELSIELFYCAGRNNRAIGTQE